MVVANFQEVWLDSHRVITRMRAFADPEHKPRHAKLVKLLDSLVLSDEIFEDRKRLRTAFGCHAGKIRRTDDADHIPNSDWLTIHIYVG